MIMELDLNFGLNKVRITMKHCGDIAKVYLINAIHNGFVHAFVIASLNFLSLVNVFIIYV